MAHRRTGGDSGGEHSGLTDNIVSLVFGDYRLPTKYEGSFSRTAPKKFLRLYTDYERRVKKNKKEQIMKRHIVSTSELLQKHIRALLSRMVFDGSDVEEVSYARL